MLRVLLLAQAAALASTFHGPAAAGYHSLSTPVPAATFVVMRANTNARRAASTKAKKTNGRRKTNKVNEFGLKYKDRFKTQKSKVEVLLLKTISGLGEAGDQIAVSLPEWENRLRKSGAAQLVEAEELSPRQRRRLAEHGKESADPEAEAWARAPISTRAAVAVYDGVYSATSQACLANADPGVYVREQGASTAAEHAIESLLRALGDAETAEVEFWGRESWAAMEAHRDADEEAASTEGRLRLPSRVLLCYGAVAAGLAAPTVLWCEPQGGNVLVGDDGGVAGSGAAGRLVLVPAVAGRVLDFDGRLMHAVPWCSAEAAAGAARADATNGSDECDASSERTVVVLNCWSDYAPKEQDDDEDDDEDENEGAGMAEEEVEVADAAAASCEPRASWTRAKIQPGAGALDEADEADEVTISLNTFGSDDPFVTRVLCSGGQEDAEDAFFTDIVNEPSRPQWLKTATPTPPLRVGIPSVDGARDERM